MTAVELIELLPESLLSDLAQETGVDYRVQKLSGKLMFSLLLYGLLEENRVSLRTLEDTFHSPKFKFFFGIPADLTTRYNSVSDRLATMNVSYFEKIYQATYALFTKYYGNTEALKYHIRRVDSTMVCEEARKLKAGMSVGCKKDGKKQVKITLSLTDMFPSSFELFTGQSALSEDIAMPVELLKETAQGNGNVISTFDRGLSARKIYAQLDTDKQCFVTRIKEKSVFEVVEEIQGVSGQTHGNLTFLAEKHIRFKQCPQHTSRLIEAENEAGKRLLFLTNCWELPLSVIIDTYHRRWDIEVFFRFLKQELNLSHLVSMNENGIQIILYMTMILAMMLLIYKKKNQYGYKTAKRRFRMELDTYITALVVEMCGGNSNLWINTPQPQGVFG